MEDDSISNNNNGNGNDGNNNNPSPSPDNDDIISLAKECGYSEYRESVSATLYFIEDRDDNGNDGNNDDNGNGNDDDFELLSRPLVKIHVYHTTRGIMTMLGHPRIAAGTNQLWRSNAYQDLADLKVFFDKPRQHTGKGYREGAYIRVYIRIVFVFDSHRIVSQGIASYCV